MKKAEKPIFVDNLTEELKSAKSVVLINYSGTNVKAQQDLKKRLKEAGARMVIVKNTLLKRAGEKSGVPAEILEDSVLSGQTALVLADEDPVAPLQVLGKFAKEFEIPQLKVGVIEGMFQDKDSLVRISQLPGKNVLLGQLLGALMAPEYGLIGTLQGNLQKLLFILKEKAKA